MTNKFLLNHRVLWLLIPLLTLFNVNVWGAADYIIPKLYLSARNTPSGNTGWTFTSATCNNAGTDYWKMVSSSSVVTSPTFDISGYTNVTVSIKWGSFGSFNKTKCNATVKISTGAGTWAELGKTGLTGASTSGTVYNFENVEESSSYSSAQIQISTPSADGSVGGRIYYVEIKGEAAGSCDASPSVGNAAYNGALVYSTSPMTVPITCPSIGAGSNCSIKDYGFVWKSGGNPTIANNKTQIGTDNHSTAFNGNISGTFAAGTTYYVKAYAINNGDNTVLSSGTYSFTPRSITFNSNGGSSVATMLVLSGTAASEPTAPTKTGYDFAGWYSNEGLTTPVNWSSTISGNKTYYAKWTVKTYDITLDREGATSGATGVTMTYNSSSFTGWSAPSKEGNTFGGYWTEDNGTGTMVIDASGNLQANVTNYTGEGGIWTKDATCTLYAKWTPIIYTVTWMSNGSQHTTTSVTYGSQPTLPSNPSSCDATSDTFYGWSTAEWSGTLDDVSDKTIYTDAFDMPAVTGDVTYYAVFAKAVKSDNFQLLGAAERFISGEDYLVEAYYSSTDHVLKAADYNSKAYQQVSENSWSLPSGGVNFDMSSRSSLCIWKIMSEGNNRFSFYNASDNKYLVLVDVLSGGNHYKNLIRSATKDATFIRTVVEGAGNNADKFTFESSSESGYYINSQTNYFQANATATQLYLYKRVTTYSKYRTNCCTALGTINGSFWWTAYFIARKPFCRAA